MIEFSLWSVTLVRRLPSHETSPEMQAIAATLIRQGVSTPYLNFEYCCSTKFQFTTDQNALI